MRKAPDVEAWKTSIAVPSRTSYRRFDSRVSSSSIWLIRLPRVRFQNLTYQHDALGDLTQRKGLRSNQTEDFVYDGLNRLRTATVKVGAAPAIVGLNLTYDKLGNICSKNGQSYTYAGRDGCNATGTSATASPHAVTQIGSQTFVYGANSTLEHDSGSGSAPERWLGYALNNPLTFTDPSGYSSWGRWLRTVAAIVITYYTGGAASSLYAAGNTAGAFAVAAAGGFAAGAIQSGTLKGGLYGAFGGAAFFGLGAAFTQANAGWAYTGGKLNSIGMIAKTVSHGMVGGVMSDLQGGKFGHGFVSAGATQAISPQIDRIGSAPGRVVATATLGGTVSSITGGKFANGAVTSAFSYALSMRGRGVARDGASTGNEKPDLEKARLAIAEARAALSDEGLLGKIYESGFKQASEDWGRVVGPIAQKYDIEMSALLYDIGGAYIFADPHSSGYRNKVMPRAGPHLPSSYHGRMAGYIHTHPDSPGLSRDDIGLAWEMSDFGKSSAHAISVYQNKPAMIWSSSTPRSVRWEDL